MQLVFSQMLNNIQSELEFIRLRVLTRPAKHMTCDKLVQCEWYISFPLYYLVLLARCDDLKITRMRHHTESDRMLAKLVAIELIESFSRNTVIIGHNTWPWTN